MRVLVKFSGESLATPEEQLDSIEGFGALKGHPLLERFPQFSWTNSRMLLKIVLDLQRARDAGIEVAVVIGGGNICRGGRDTKQIQQRSNTDKIGMLATVMNGLLIQTALEEINQKSVVLAARSMSSVCDLYTAERAQAELSFGKIVICVGGSGLPFFSTDTAAVIRACEMRCDRLLKATKVDGAYDSDPHTNPNAVFLPVLTYDEFLNRQLKIMDATAVSLAKDEHMPIDIANTYADNVIVKTCRGGITTSRIGD